MRTDPESDIERTSASEGDGDTLPTGAEVGSLRVRRLLWRNSLVAVYAGFDSEQQRRMLVAEYFPTAWAMRGQDAAVDLRSIEHADDFAQGLNDFAELARVRAQVDHPSLVRVRRIWEENGTCYVAQPYPNARSLREDLERSRDWSDEARLIKRLLVPVLGALQKLHASSITHGAVSPDSVLIPAERTWLLDQGPVPEHADESWLGAKPAKHAARAAADLRALAEVACFALTGAERTETARAQPPSQTLHAGAKKSGGGPRYSDQLLGVLDTLYAAKAGATDALCAELLESMSDAEQMLANAPRVQAAEAPQSLAEALQEPPAAAPQTPKPTPPVATPAKAPMRAAAPTAADLAPNTAPKSANAPTMDAPTTPPRTAKMVPPKPTAAQTMPVEAPRIDTSPAASAMQSPVTPAAKPAAARASSLRPPPPAGGKSSAPPVKSAEAARAAFAADLAQVTASLSQHAQAVAGASPARAPATVIAKPIAAAPTLKRPAAPTFTPDLPPPVAEPIAAKAPPAAPPVARPIVAIEPPVAIPAAQPVPAVQPPVAALDRANSADDESDEPLISTGIETALAEEISAFVDSQPSSVDVPVPPKVETRTGGQPAASPLEVEPTPQPIFDVSPHFGTEPIPTQAEHDVALTSKAAPMLDELLPQPVARESALERWPELAALPVLPQPKEGPYKPARQRQNMMLAGAAVAGIALIGLWLASSPSRKPPPNSLQVAEAMAAAAAKAPRPVLETEMVPTPEPAAGPTTPAQTAPAATSKAPATPAPLAPVVPTARATTPPSIGTAPKDTAALTAATVAPAQPATVVAATAPATTAAAGDSAKAKPVEAAVQQAAPAQKVAAAGTSSGNPYPSPRSECGARTNFSLYTCMQKQCKSPQFSAHIQCVMLREKDEVIE